MHTHTRTHTLQMFMGAVDERALAASQAEAEARQAEEQKAREALFPSLSGSSPQQQHQMPLR
jgi:outer membrane protein TolC